MKTLELCRSNSIGSRFHAPTVVEIWENVSDRDAEILLAEVRPNGFFVREQPEDTTGN